MSKLLDPVLHKNRFCIVQYRASFWTSASLAPSCFPCQEFTSLQCLVLHPSYWMDETMFIVMACLDLLTCCN